MPAYELTRRPEIISILLKEICRKVESGIPLTEALLNESIVQLANHLGLPKEKEVNLRSIKNKRIALVIPYHPLDEVGGLEIATRMLAKELAESGNTVQIISRGKYDHADLQGIKISPEGIPVIGCGSGIEEISKYLIDHADNFDVVQWMEIFPPVPETPETYNDKAEQQYLASVVLRALGKGVFLYVATSGNVTRRGINNANWDKSKENQPLNFLLEHAFHGINFTNPEIQDEFGLDIHIDRRRKQFIPLGVDVDQFQPISQMEKFAVREKLGLPQDKYIFVYLGRFVMRKKADLLLQAWSTLPDEVKSRSHLILAGGAAGKGQPDSIYEYVIELLETSTNVTNIDMLPHDDVPKLLAASDAFVFPSEREGWPLVVLEAMSCGLPVISTTIDSLKMMIDVHSGVLFEPNNVNSLVSAMTDMFSATTGEKPLTITSRQRVTNYWTWKNTAQKFISQYEQE